MDLPKRWENPLLSLQDRYDAALEEIERLTEGWRTAFNCGIHHQDRAKVLAAALGRIAKWEGEFPATGRYYDEPENTQPMSYRACYGSNGERDYMRQIAHDALTQNAEVKGD